MTTATKMRPSQRHNPLSFGRILAWLAGVVVVSSLGASVTLMIAMNWSAMGGLVRIAMTLGLGLAIFIVVLLGMNDDRQRWIRTPLLLISGALQFAGIVITVDEYLPGGDWRYAAMTAAVVLLLQQGATYLRYRRTEVAITTVLAALCLLSFSFDLLLRPEI